MYILGQTPQKTAFPWLTQAPVTQTFGENGETGVDLALDYGTPITALVSGQVGGAGYDPSGGYMSILFSLAGKPTALYYQHLDQVVVGVGQYVKVGQLIGYSGGQLVGGFHPSSPKSSTGPHIEVGLNFPWGGGRNPHMYTPSFDPLPLLAQLAGNMPLTGLGGVGAAVVATVTSEPGFGTIAASLNDALQFRGVTLGDPVGDLMANTGAFVGRGIFVIMGLAILLGVVSYLMRKPLAGVAKVGAAFTG